MEADGDLKWHRGKGVKKHFGEVRYCDKPECQYAWEEYRADASTVPCDAMCGAPDEPKNGREYAKAYIHWRDHSVMSGCSHGS